MKPLFVLWITFAIALFALRFTGGSWSFAFPANIAMSVMLVFTAIGHFAYTKGMQMMLPPFIPFKKIMVLLSGAIEIAAAIGLLIPALQKTTSVLLILFFIVILPCNIYAARKKVDYQKGTYEGPGNIYLWFRVPLQIFFIGWIWLFDLSKFA